LYILLAIFIFGALIFIHELGHFIVARLCGVKVLEFAIGMGPKLFSIKSKKSGTVYAIRLFPIGGFVSMLGENGMEPVQGSSQLEDQAPTDPSESNENTELGDGFFVSSNDKHSDGTYDPKAESREQVVDAETAKHAYCNQSVWKRILISIAGPAMNIILGFVLMLVIVILGGHGNVGTTVVSGFYVTYTGEESYMGLQKDDYIIGVNGVEIDSYGQMKELVEANAGGAFTLHILRWNADEQKVDELELQNVILDTERIGAEYITYSRSEQGGLRPMDRVVKVNNTPVHTAYELSYELMMQGYRPLTITVIRDGKQMVLENITLPNEADPETGVQMGVIDFYIYPEPDFGAGTVLKHTWYRSLSNIKMVFDSLSGLFSGRYGFEAVSGPVGITKTITEMAQMGYMYVLQLVTLISINLGVMNLLPFPALDGGHLLIYAIEAIRRKPLKPEIEGIINFVGLVLILGLAVLILIKDIIAL